MIAANRVGTEEVVPCQENGGQKSSLKFYGSSFITDGTGGLVKEMGRAEEGAICASFDLDQLREYRRKEVMGSPYRRPETYGPLLGG